jgi:HEAT repeat protein
MKKIALLVCGLAVVAGATRTSDAQRSRMQAAGTQRAGGVLATPVEDPADSLFRIGRNAINDNDYRRAANLFKQIVDKYPRSTKAGDALFWRAYVLHKLGTERRSKSDLDDALQAIEEQQKSYASASTAEDGKVLRSQIRSAQAALGDPAAAGDVATQSRGVAQARTCGSKSDEETRIAALEGLMNMSAEDAVPILKEVLKQRDACRTELRKRAVWLISQKRGNDVPQTLLEVARNDPSPEVRGDAIFWMSQTRSELAVPLLDSILFTSKDEDVREKAVFSLSQLAGRNERARAALRRAAEDEKMSEEIRGNAIFWLGQANLVDLTYFKTLFNKTTDRELREKIVFAVSQTSGGDATTWLQELARDKKVDMDTRKNAIFHLSQRRAVDLPALISIYDQSKGEDEIQDQVLFALTQRREAAATDKLFDVAKNDPNIDRRKQAMFWLGQKNDPRVKELLREILIRP